MTTNKEWLFSLPLDEQYAWMNAEHVQQPVADASERVTNQAEMLDDSREQLEADARKIADAYNMDSQRHGTERFAHELYYSIIHLLDRQRALSYEVCDECSKEYYELQDEVNELQAQVDTLKSRHCPHYHVNEHTCDVHETRIAELTAERDELTRAVNELQKKQPYCYDPGAPLDTLNTIGRYIDELTAEREHYRDLFGKCLDYADAIHALMDEGMA